MVAHPQTSRAHKDGTREMQMNFGHRYSRRACSSPAAGFQRRTRSLLGALCALALVPALCGAAPKPPSSICTNSAHCTPDQSPAPQPAGAVKWNPGHYLLPFLSDSWRDKQPVRFGYYDEIANNPSVEGATIYVTWKELEPT